MTGLGRTRALDDGVSRARVRRWPGEPGVAHLVLVDHTMTVAESTLRNWIGLLVDEGASSIRTGALSPAASAVFADLGFEVIQELVLMGRPLSRRDSFSPPEHQLRPLRSVRAVSAAARIDQSAFAAPWHLDEDGIDEALNATPNHRIRLAISADDDPAGYLVTGRNGAAGFIQRLAVDPAHQGRGIATSLLCDGMTWLSRRGVREVLVNTHRDNLRALHLYERFGFHRLDDELCVLELHLDGASA